MSVEKYGWDIYVIYIYIYFLALARIQKCLT